MWFHIPQYCNPRFNMIHVSLRCLHFLQEMEKGSSRNFQVFLVLGSGCNYLLSFISFTPMPGEMMIPKFILKNLGGWNSPPPKLENGKNIFKQNWKQIPEKIWTHFRQGLGGLFGCPLSPHLAEGSTASAPPAKKVGKVEGWRVEDSRDDFILKKIVKFPLHPNTVF